MNLRACFSVRGVGLLLATLGLLTPTLCRRAAAAPSLDAKHLLTLTVARQYKRKKDGPTRQVMEAYTLMRDHENPLIWFYFPNGPRLAEKAGRPELELLKYQLQDDRGKLVEGSILQFSTTMGVDPKTHQALLTALASKLNDMMTKRTARSIQREIKKLEGEKKPSNRPLIAKLRNDAEIKLALAAADPKARRVRARHVRLSVMPFKSARVNIYTPGDSPSAVRKAAQQAAAEAAEEEGEESDCQDEDEEFGPVPYQPGKFVGAVSRREGIAPQFPSQKMPFTLELSKLGTPVYRALLTGNTGLNVIYEVTYDAVTPEAGFTVTIDWKKAYNYYKREIEQNAGFSGNIKGINLDLAQSYDDIDEQIKSLSDKFIDIKVDEGYAFTAEDRRTFLLPIMQRIAATIMDTSPPPTIAPKSRPVSDVPEGCQEEEPPADAGDAAGEAVGGATEDTAEFAEDLAQDDEIPPEDGIGAEIAENIPNSIPKFSASVKIKVRKLSSEQLIKETINFRIRQFVERKTIVGGFVGLGDYDPAVQKTCFRTVKKEDWDAAWFLLPDVQDRTMRKLGVTTVDLTMTLVARNSRSRSRRRSRKQIRGSQVVTAKWRVPPLQVASSDDDDDDEEEEEVEPAGGRWDCNFLQPGNRVAFPLLSILESKKYKREDLQFRIDTKITRLVGVRTQIIEDTYYVDVFDGQLPLSSAAANLMIIRVEPERRIPLAKKPMTEDELDELDDEDLPELDRLKVKLIPNVNPKPDYDLEAVLKTRRDQAVFMLSKPRGDQPLTYQLQLTFYHGELGEFTYAYPVTRGKRRGKPRIFKDSSVLLTGRAYKRLEKAAEEEDEEE